MEYTVEAEYTVRQINSLQFEVAKFTGSKWPEVVYRVDKGGFCTCPSYGACRHYRIVRKHIELGYPIMNTYWVAKDGTVNGFYANVTEAWRKELENVDKRPTTPRKRVAGKRRSGRNRDRK